MSETPLHPWSIVEKNGNILCAHCNCMAGLGECYSHVGAVFYVEFAVNLRDSKTCTKEEAYRLLPGYKKVEYKPVADIDFTSAITLHQNMKKQAAKSGAHKNNPPPRKTTRKSTDDEISAFYEKLSKYGTKPAILSIVPGYTNCFEPSLLKSNYPQSSKDLYKIEHLTLNYKELLTSAIMLIFPSLLNNLSMLKKQPVYKLIVINGTILEQGE